MPFPPGARNTRRAPHPVQRLELINAKKDQNRLAPMYAAYGQQYLVVKSFEDHNNLGSVNALRQPQHSCGWRNSCGECAANEAEFSYSPSRERVCAMPASRDIRGPAVSLSDFESATLRLGFLNDLATKNCWRVTTLASISGSDTPSPNAIPAPYRCPNRCASVFSCARPWSTRTFGELRYWFSETR